MAARARIDKLLVERGLFDSRARAQAAVLAGQVSVNGAVAKKPGQEVDEDAQIEARDLHPYVSRGGLKLEAGLDAFGFEVKGKRALDVGSSTGGFTDVLLTRGAASVVAVDVGHDQFHPRLRERPEVRLFEGTDIRRLEMAQVGNPVDVVVSDVSFISLALVLPPALAFAAEQAALVALVKPQFEAGPAHVKKGVVKDAAIHEAVCARVRGEVEALGWRVLGLVPSPIEGGDGNREFLLGAVRP
ncbi:23S rRNA (cytidine1920-2'-O)/16S rRNA (cytidine1409-2'-O)-methyltransferase [Azorhizobium sp. AG788]|uniref:TlyA family RNA methyltransferase n=1 Tax=Azorhizobium sp. AG788 TaxID=2183897 RepID=UPI0010609BD4|nr:TlyA family RNA methyltransferase [Azorhizobium sp. AG788]TDT93560.1 23S rRNA (cytidine1920-2'-O)/16S rRNA (cytidine1409-2'-O)-methyltransferase [Azorhizobium sp. AG788]